MREGKALQRKARCPEQPGRLQSACPRCHERCFPFILLTVWYRQNRKPHISTIFHFITKTFVLCDIRMHTVQEDLEPTGTSSGAALSCYCTMPGPPLCLRLPDRTVHLPRRGLLPVACEQPTAHPVSPSPPLLRRDTGGPSSPPDRADQQAVQAFASFNPLVPTLLPDIGATAVLLPFTQSGPNVHSALWFRSACPPHSVSGQGRSYADSAGRRFRRTGSQVSPSLADPCPGKGGA